MKKNKKVEVPKPHETHGVKYLGSKKTILPWIECFIRNGIEPVYGKINTALDVFTGTTRVAQYLRQMGIQTYTSDLSWASACYANTFVHNGDNSHLQKYIDQMNQLPPEADWLTQNYTGDTPEDAETGTGRCWKRKNASKADAARNYIDSLNLEPWEKDTLITSVIFALDKVDNTVGVQQAYLKKWCARSHNDIQFVLPPCITGPVAQHLCGNALTLDYPRVDLAYLDPPYSPHSYSTYYHIWDSIVRWDKPETSLTARRRNDRVARHEDYDKSMESDWNVRGKAVGAFERLIERLPARFIMISYNDESIVKQDDLLALAHRCDINHEPMAEEIDYRRNIMSQIGRAAMVGVEPKKGQKNKELVIVIERGL